jgi:hypothetical protein
MGFLNRGDTINETPEMTTTDKTLILNDPWKSAYKRFGDVGFFKESPDDGAQVRRVFFRLSQGPITIPPRIVLWRRHDSDMDSDMEKHNFQGYYLFKWDQLLFLLYLDGTGEISSFPGPISHQLFSEEEAVCHLEKNAKVYEILETLQTKIN